MGRRPGSYPYPRRLGVDEINRQLIKEDKERQERVRAYREKKEIEAKEARERHAESVKGGFTVTTGKYKGWRKLSDYEVRKQRGELTPEERAKEAQAAIFEAEAARADEQNWVSEFTPQQRHEISIYETAKGRVRSDDMLGGQEKIDMLSALDQKISSFEKIRRPRRPDEPLYPDGQNVGQSWMDESGATFTREPNGTQKLLVRPDQTIEYLREKAQQGLEEKQRMAEEKHAVEIEKYIRDLRTERIKYDEAGTEIAKERYRTPAEVYEETLRAYPELAGPQFMPQQQQQTMGPAEPEVVTQAREALKTGWGMGLKKRKKAKDILKAWKYSQRGQKKHITKAEFDKLPSGATFRDPEGKLRRKS